MSTVQHKDEQRPLSLYGEVHTWKETYPTMETAGKRHKTKKEDAAGGKGTMNEWEEQCLQQEERHLTKNEERDYRKKKKRTIVD